MLTWLLRNYLDVVDHNFAKNYTISTVWPGKQKRGRGGDLPKLAKIEGVEPDPHPALWDSVSHVFLLCSPAFLVKDK